MPKIPIKWSQTQILFFFFLSQKIFVCVLKLKKLRHIIRTWKYWTSSSEIYETSRTKTKQSCERGCVYVMKKRFRSLLLAIEKLVPICWYFHHLEFFILMFYALSRNGWLRTVNWRLYHMGNTHTVYQFSWRGTWSWYNIPYLSR